MANYTPGFHHIDSIGRRQVLSSLEDNIKSFLDWSFVNIGGFINVNIPTSNIANSLLHKLKLATDPANTSNTIWESEKKDWIYETGVSYSGMQPIEISGIYLNNNFLVGPTGYQPYTYSLDYKNGRVVFDNPVNQNSDVEIEYSYRYVQSYTSSEMRGLEINNEVLSANKVQLPAILIEMTDRTSQKPWELGNSKNLFYQDILLHILANNATQRNNISNALMLQKDKGFYLYDIDQIIQNGVYWYNADGSINPNRLNYDTILNDPKYIFKKAFIQDATITEFNLISSSIYHNIVRWTVEIFPD